ncbi:MAG: hypothetical protein WC130_05105 [Kiritimatiellia bacterium]
MNNLGDRLQVKNLEAVKAVTDNGDSSALDLDGLDGEIAVIVDVKNEAGTLPTLALKLQHCETSGGSYTDVTGGGFTSYAAVASVQKISLNRGELHRYVKLNRVIGGTDDPEYLLSAKVLGVNKYQD